MSVQAQVEALTPEGVEAAYAELARRAGLQMTAPEWEQLFLDWNSIKERISGERARREFHEAQDTRDPVAEAANTEMRERILPVAEAQDAELGKAMLRSPHRAHLESRFGMLLFARFELSQRSFSPKNIPLNVEVGDLAARYERLLGGATVTINGDAITLPRAYALFSHPDEATRQAAWGGVAEWILSNGDALHGFYDEMALKRQAMAENLSLENFVPLGYRRMGRLDYGPADVARFREGIKRHIVPLHAAWRAKQAKLLGAPTVKPWNMMYYPGLSLSPGVAPIDQQIRRGQALFDTMHPVLGGHFRHMVETGRIDLENRPGKRPGAFCTSFDDEHSVAIFCNSTGDEQDVSTLTHEMGHAFQGWESQWIVPVELRWPTNEACEVHSMGMEFLSLRHLGEFFSPQDVAKFRKLKLVDTITLVPYIAVVDEFQHWVYEHPGHTREARDAAWCGFWDTYMLGLDFSGYEAWKATRWKRQAHIFVDPFYYIDYAIAESGALQLWRMAETDPQRTMQAYLQLCHLGGTRSLLDLFSGGSLVSPFDPDVFAPAAEAIRRELEL